MTRRTGTLLMLGASVAALIATSKEVPPAATGFVTIEEALELEPGESVTYQIAVSHDLDADADARMSVSVGASVFASPEDSTLGMSFSEDGAGDTGDPVVERIGTVLVEGTLVTGAEDYTIDAVPVLTLTADDNASLSGTLEVEVGITLYSAQDTGDTIGELTAELVNVTE